MTYIELIWDTTTIEKRFEFCLIPCGWPDETAQRISNTNWSKLSSTAQKVILKGTEYKSLL